MTIIKSYAAKEAAPICSAGIRCRRQQPEDVEVEVEYCGISPFRPVDDRGQRMGMSSYLLVAGHGDWPGGGAGQRGAG